MRFLRTKKKGGLQSNGFGRRKWRVKRLSSIEKGKKKNTACAFWTKKGKKGESWEAILPPMGKKKKKPLSLSEKGFYAS